MVAGFFVLGIFLPLFVVCLKKFTVAYPHLLINFLLSTKTLHLKNLKTK